jgi:F0F1-type ATP synthase assembly protein I
MANSDSRSDGSTGYARLIGVGFSFLIIMSVCVGGGVLADRLLDTLPLFMLLGLVAGFGLGLCYIYFAIEKMGGG